MENSFSNSLIWCFVNAVRSFLGFEDRSSWYESDGEPEKRRDDMNTYKHYL